MDDSISRQAAIDSIRKIKAMSGTADDEILLIDKAEAMMELMRMASAEPERKKGKWIGIDDYPYGTWECDQCGCIYEETLSWVPNFCPNCGAEMKGEAE